jgi:hypothetical protein
MTGSSVPAPPKPSSRIISDWSLDASLKTASYPGSADGVEAIESGLDNLALESLPIDMSRLPKEYLEVRRVQADLVLAPGLSVPAFVLINDVPPQPWANGRGIEPTSVIDLPFTPTSPLLPTFTPVWANEPWKLAAEGKPLLSCLSIESARMLGEWLSGAQDLRFRSISGATSNLNIPDLDSPDAVPETSPGSISDVTNAPSLTSASTQDTTPRARLLTRCLRPPLTLEFNFPSGPRVFEVVRSTMPVYYSNRKESSQIGTHTFAVITTIPRPASEAPPKRRLSHVTPKSVGIPAVTMVELEDEFKTPRFQRGLSWRARCSREDLKNPDGRQNPIHPTRWRARLSQAAQFTSTAMGESETSSPPPNRRVTTLLVRTSTPCLDHVDWAQTSLGPRDDWSQSLKTSGAYPRLCPLLTSVSMVLNYPLKACLCGAGLHSDLQSDVCRE